MHRNLHFYNYSQCFEYYTQRIMNIRQAKIRGEVIVAKPVLLLSVIDGMEQTVFKGNEFVLDDWLEGHYRLLMQQYARGSQFGSITPINNPFWHLVSDGFWHLNVDEVGAEKTDRISTPSIPWLKAHVRFAYLDDDLWILLSNKEWRTKMREYIIEHKLTHSEPSWKTLVAEGFGAIAAIIAAGVA